MIYDVSTFTLKVNGFTIFDGPQGPGNQGITTVAKPHGYDDLIYALHVSDFPVTGVTEPTGLQFYTDLTLDSGVIKNGKVPTPAQIDGHVQLVQTGLSLSSDYSPTSTAYSYAAVSDDAYTLTETTGVPEPGVWALMIAGFGLVGASARRDKSCCRVL